MGLNPTDFFGILRYKKLPYYLRGEYPAWPNGFQKAPVRLNWFQKAIQGPRSSRCKGCNCTRQFYAILVLIYTFSELLLTISSFSKVYCENVTFTNKMSLSSANPLLATSILHPSIQTKRALLSNHLHSF